jgi:hypothetical protein
MDAKTEQNAGLTNRAAVDSTEVTSLLFVSTAGRGAGSSGSAPAFFTGSSKQAGGRDRLKKRPPDFAGRRADDTITGGVKKIKGVFGVGALLPQFLAELTITLNSQIWNHNSISVTAWQASGFSAVQIPQPLARELGLAFRHEFPKDSGPS